MVRPVDLLGDILEEGDVAAAPVHIDAGVAGAIPGDTKLKHLDLSGNSFICTNQVTHCLKISLYLVL